MLQKTYFFLFIYHIFAINKILKVLFNRITGCKSIICNSVYKLLNGYQPKLDVLQLYGT